MRFYQGRDRMGRFGLWAVSTRHASEKCTQPKHRIKTRKRLRMHQMLFKPNTQPGLLLLENGAIFKGIAIGALGTTCGELIFTTSMTGYQETLTDPSYAGQMVTFTAPHIGSVGCNHEDMESAKVWPQACLMGHLPISAGQWREKQSLVDFLKQNNTIALAELDTRTLTQMVRDTGSLKALVTTEDTENLTRWQKELAHFKPPQSPHWIQAVSCKTTSTWQESSWRAPRQKRSKPCHIAVLDFGVKREILRKLHSLGATVVRHPYNTSAKDLLATQPDGVLLSNGPGDPRELPDIVREVAILLEHNIPIMGICLGIQLLALAVGGRCYKLKFGQHGANHPVMQLEDAKDKEKHAWITLQNHNYAVDEASLPEDIIVTHRALFDQSVQGIRHKTKPIIAFQGHPEANPGPKEAGALFSTWLDSIDQAKTDKESS